MAIDWLDIYLQEDLGQAGDITTTPLFGADAPGTARVVVREGGVAAGLAHGVEVFRRLDVEATRRASDGDAVAAGDVLVDVQGPVRGILAAERTVLNVIGRMSGIATRTRRLTRLLSEAGARGVVAGTRKTTPGFRAFEKEAIRVGGGDPHRMGLYDAMMVKDNHIAAAGDAAQATRRLREVHPDVPLEVEVESLDDALAAAAAGADWVLIDNQDAATGRAWAEALRDAHPGIRVEASGGITEETLTAYGWADRISLGALTHAASLDVGLDWGRG